MNTDKVVLRKFPLFARILIVLYLAILLFIVGLMIGFGILGNPMDVFDLDTWKHIVELTKEG
ncbi:DNA-directed RNA polymerase subunit beta [Abyssicoccus albus]|uniref:DNA-directed RNA polymerase subunit beta n=1 Tax=Abyssicoccus albus TaxID=1817405 RepID=A0A1Q1G036_9BACL|nr:DNA-directed RNA polymerase subunit beta [Abyssicoccus albus]AQL55711.1 hypothetical protein BVH56_01455 [Abyssicoccus albus]RPF56432.1 DNA-directed RNA polymerase subunit beta [Abyssicoccus albus]